MNSTNIAPPTGTRDFNASTIYKRQLITDIIQSVFIHYGFEPLETPAFEYLDILTEKYGQEGDQLLFKILNSGLGKHKKPEQLKEALDTLIRTGRHSSIITERALRYDLTIPLARYVMMNYHQLTFPFRRYQIQPVWRADKPQKGRYREFVQCDVDILGQESLWNEIDLIHIYLDVFGKLEMDVEIQLNHRRLLESLKEVCEISTNDKTLITTIDKLDKIGKEAVLAQLEQTGIKQDKLRIIQQFLSLEGSFEEQLQKLNKLFASTQPMKQVKKDLAFILKNIHHKNAHQVKLKPQLARGLDYYTAFIIEVKSNHKEFQTSIGGGGRYSDLTATLSNQLIPGVGISFGLDRIYNILEATDQFPQKLTHQQRTQVLWLNLDQVSTSSNYSTLQQLRAKGVRSELFGDSIKLEKQLKYAEKKEIPFIIICGEKEIKANHFIVKNIESRQQIILSKEELLAYSF